MSGFAHFVSSLMNTAFSPRRQIFAKKLFCRFWSSDAALLEGNFVLKDESPVQRK